MDLIIRRENMRNQYNVERERKTTCISLHTGSGPEESELEHRRGTRPIPGGGGTLLSQSVAAGPLPLFLSNLEHARGMCDI